jgi:hypothetical protein
MPTMKVKPWGKDQGEYVVIDSETFDPSVHKEYSPAAPKEEAPKEEAPSQKQGKRG